MTIERQEEIRQQLEERGTGEGTGTRPGGSLECMDYGKKELGNLRIPRTNFGNPQDGRVYSAKGSCITLTLCMPPKILIEDNGEYKVRELSGYEGLTLMGVPKEDVDKIKASGLTNGQMMKLAGNSIIVDVMSSFFKEMIKC